MADPRTVNVVSLMYPSRSAWAALLAILVLLAILAFTACTSGVPGVPDPSGPAGGIDGVVHRELNRTFAPGAVVVVVRSDTVGFLDSYGVLRAGSTEPLPLGARFKVGAVMPVVNALAASHLEALGLLSLDAPVGDYVPDLPEALHAPTVAQLLAHTGGLVAVPALAGRQAGDDLSAAVHRLVHLDRLTDPGAIYSRSEPGIALAAVAMAQAAGTSYPELLDAVVFRPLGLARTRVGFPGDSAVTPGHTMSLDREGPILPHDPRPDSVMAVPVRGLYSTAMDLANLMRAFLGDGVVDGERRLPAGVVERALRPRAAMPGGDGQVTMGPVIGEWEGRTHIAMGGSGGGHAVIMRLLPDDGIGVAVLANHSGGYLARVPDFVLRRFLAAAPPSGSDQPAGSDRAAGSDQAALVAPAVVDLPASELAGSYWNGGEGIELVAEGGALRLRSGDLVLNVERRDDRYHAVIPDGRTALTFRVVRDAGGRLYLYLQDRALARDP